MAHGIGTLSNSSKGGKATAAPKYTNQSRDMAPCRPFERGGTPSSRRRRPDLLGICNSLGLTSTSVRQARQNSDGTPTTTVGSSSSTASERRRGMVRARRAVALSNIQNRSKFLAKRAAVITRDVKAKLVQKSRRAITKLESYERRYQLSQSAVSGACTSTVMNILCGSLVLGATSLVVAGVSVVVAERMRRRRRTGGAATTSTASSYLGPSGRSFLSEGGGRQGTGAGDYVHRRQS